MYDYDYNAVGAAAGGLAVGVIILIGIVVLLCLAIAIVSIVGTWKVLEKGGKPGWAALVPFYNSWVLCEMVGVWPWWVLIVLGCSLVGAAIPVFGSLISMAASIYYAILVNVSLARAFGKEDTYAIGLILLSPVFTAILGFGKDEFKGQNPMNDVVMDKIRGASNNSSNASDKNTKFCTSCGGKMDKKSSFCPSCGKKVK